MESDKPYETEDLIRALNHRVRRQILRVLNRSRRPLSPTQIEEKLGLGGKLSQISYHVTTLSAAKVISLVDEQQVRGAMEHFYVSAVSDNALVRGLLKGTQKSDAAQLKPEKAGLDRQESTGEV
jgi:DNA-binding transcriptional ArsR family regulator